MNIQTNSLIFETTSDWNICGNIVGDQCCFLEHVSLVTTLLKHRTFGVRIVGLTIEQSIMGLSKLRFEDCIFFSGNGPRCYHASPLPDHCRSNT